MNLIAAIGKNGELGLNNKLILPIKEDLNRFKQLTLNGVVIMGNNTFKGDLKSKKLSNRINIVLTRNLNDYEYDENLYYVNNIDTATNLATSFNKTIWVIGGEKTYLQFMSRINNLYITHINQEFDNATSFLKLNFDEWVKIKEIQKEKFKWSTYIRKIHALAAFNLQSDSQYLLHI